MLPELEDIPTMQPVVEANATTSLAHKRDAERKANKLKEKPEGRPQPLATAHLDPRNSPEADVDGVYTHIRATKRFMVRKGYVFYRGEKDAYKGPQWVYIGPEEMIGQEHKFDLSMSDTPGAVALTGVASEVGVDPDLGAHARRKIIAETRDKLAILENEEELATAETVEAKKVRDDPRSLQTPPQNPEADRMPMGTESPAATAIQVPDLPPEPVSTAEGVAVGDVAVGGEGNEGEVSGPSPNPAATPAPATPAPKEKKRGRGRPKGATSMVGRVDLAE